MKTIRVIIFSSVIFFFAATLMALCVSQADAKLPSGVKAVWDLEKAYREKLGSDQIKRLKI